MALLRYRPNLMDEEGHKMSFSIQQTTSAEPGFTQTILTDLLCPSAFNPTDTLDRGQPGGEKTNLNHPKEGKAEAFTMENSNFEFYKLNQCIETSRNFGEISVDDAETLVFFLELVRESLTTLRYRNA